MKNLLIYTSPAEKFHDEAVVLMRIQIDNSLDLGWKPADILVVTNFDWEYRGVKALVIPYVASPCDPASNKAYVIKYLIDHQLLPDDVYWCHDYDAYENYAVDPVLERDFAVCKYGYKDEYQCGAYFFRPSAIDIFNVWIKAMEKRPRSRSDEKYFRKMVLKQWIRPIQELNVTYNFTFKFVQTNFMHALMPLRVVHFHPAFKDNSMNHTCLEIFMYGKNRLKMPLMSDRLIKIFQANGIQ